MFQSVCVRVCAREGVTTTHLKYRRVLAKCAMNEQRRPACAACDLCASGPVPRTRFLWEICGQTRGEWEPFPKGNLLTATDATTQGMLFLTARGSARHLNIPQVCNFKTTIFCPTVTRSHHFVARKKLTLSILSPFRASLPLTS